MQVDLRMGSKPTTIKAIPVVLGLLLIDLSGVYVSFYLAAAVRKVLIPMVGGEVYWPVYLPMVYLAMSFTVVLFFLAKLYPGYGLTAVVEIERIVKSLTLTYAFLAVSVYVFKVYEYFPRSIFLLAWVLSLILVSIGRFAFRNRVSMLQVYGFPVLFISNSSAHIRGLEAVQNCRRMGWNPLAVLILDEGKSEQTCPDIPILSSWKEFEKIRNRSNVDTVLVSLSNIDQDSQILRSLSETFKRLVLIYPADYLGSVWVQPRDLEGRLGLELRYHLLEPNAILIKQVVDYLLGGLLFIFLSPVLLLIALSIKLESPGPVFFRQERLGKHLSRFKILKFRTMEADAEQRLISLLQENPRIRQEYERHHKLEVDPRLTRVGKWLRKYSLDELPQLWNVIRGEISLIGPRPYMPSELDAMGRYAEIILRVKPGLTGWWQVMGRHETPFQRRLKLDQYYISNWSLWLDLYIFLKTFWVILRGQGT